MGWEWRIVFEGDIRDKFIAHATKACPELKPHNNEAEERQDIYVSCSHGVGAKLRGEERMSDGIEVKRLLDVKKRGAEYWEKILIPLQPRLTVDPETETQSSLVSDVLHILQKDDVQAGHVPTEVQVSKSRVQYKIGAKGVWLECTVLEIKPEGRMLTTVCIESKKDAKKIYEAVDTLSLQDLEPQLRWTSSDDHEGEEWTKRSCVGYPALVFRIAQERQIRAGQSSS